MEDFTLILEYPSVHFTLADADDGCWADNSLVWISVFDQCCSCKRAKSQGAKTCLITSTDRHVWLEVPTYY